MKGAIKGANFGDSLHIPYFMGSRLWGATNRVSQPSNRLAIMIDGEFNDGGTSMDCLNGLYMFYAR